MASDSARREDHFQKKICPKRTFPSNFVKWSQKYFIYFWQKNGRLLFCCFVLLFCCFVVLFVATLSDFGLLFFLIEALIELRKML